MLEVGSTELTTVIALLVLAQQKQAPSSPKVNLAEWESRYLTYWKARKSGNKLDFLRMVAPNLTTYTTGGRKRNLNDEVIMMAQVKRILPPVLSTKLTLVSQSATQMEFRAITLFDGAIPARKTVGKVISEIRTQDTWKMFPQGWLLVRSKTITLGPVSPKG